VKVVAIFGLTEPVNYGKREMMKRSYAPKGNIMGLKKRKGKLKGPRAQRTGKKPLIIGAT